MVDRTRARRLIAGLVAAHVVLHAVALAMMLRCPSYSQWPYLIAIVVIRAPLMLGPSQGALLAIWTILGGGRLVWRVLFTTIGVFIYLQFFGSADPDWLIATIGELGVCAMILLVARLTGLVLAKSSDLAASPHPFQFYIRDMLIWTTVLAMLLSAWRCLPPDATGFWHSTIKFCHLLINRRIDAAVLASLTVVAVASMFCALGAGWFLARILSLPLAIGVAVKLMTWTIGQPSLTPEYATSLAFMVFWLVGSLLVLRAAGYRLARRPEVAEPQAAEAENGESVGRIS
jgi:hypothetical protein